MRIYQIEPDREQPRKHFDQDALNELADSIAKHGIIQPIVVRKSDGYYKIIAGERRWRAARIAGLKEVPVIIADQNEEEAAELSLLENIQREDLNPVEKAEGYKKLMDTYHLSAAEVAEKLSKSRPYVANAIRLLNLPPDVLEKVRDGDLSEGHARIILRLPNQELMKKAAAEIIKQHLSVHASERYVEEMAKKEKVKVRKVNRKDSRSVLLKDLSSKIESSLGTKVSIKQSSKKKGMICIEYYGDDDLDRLYEILTNRN